MSNKLSCNDKLSTIADVYRTFELTEKHWRDVAYALMSADYEDYCDNYGGRLSYDISYNRLCRLRGQTAYGKMKADIDLLSTNLRLKRGSIVKIIPADNTPCGRYYASPADGVWPDDSGHSPEHSPEDSILIPAEAFEFLT